MHYGLLDRSVDEVIEFFPRLDEAEATLEQILVDEPGWVGMFEVVGVDFGGGEPVVELT